MTMRVPIPAPPATPPRYSLIRAASDAGLSTDALYHGWTFDPEVCGGERGGITPIDCIGSFEDAAAHPGNPAIVTGTPFAVWATDECSTLDSARREWQGRVRRMLAAVESYWLARALAGEGGLGLEQRTLNDAASTTLGGGAAVDAVSALALVEAALAVALRGQVGQVHVTADVFVILVANQAVRLDGTLWKSPGGHTVVMDAGYTGAGPGDQEADLVAGERWMYGTSNIGVSLGAVEIIPDSAAEGLPNAQWTARDVNTATLYAARLATWVWDECAHVAANVDTTAGAPGGGGGGAPDYSALLTAIAAATSDTDTNTDTLEALVLALGTNTDGLEALVTSSNTKLDSVVAAVDGLEGFTDGLEALIGTTNGSLATLAGAVQTEDAVATDASARLMVGMKRADTPAASGADGDVTNPLLDGLGAQWVHPIKTSETIKVAIAGLTNAAYAANEQLGTEITVAGASRLAGWGGVIGRLVVVDDLKVLSGNTANFDVYIMDQAITGATDNNTFDDTDSDIGNVLDVIRFTDTDHKRDHTSNTIYSRSGLSIPYTCVATSLFALLVTRTALSGGWSSATAIRLNFGLLLD